jgi:hypothetical protein
MSSKKADDYCFVLQQWDRKLLTKMQRRQIDEVLRILDSVFQQLGAPGGYGEAVQMIESAVEETGSRGAPTVVPCVTKFSKGGSRVSSHRSRAEKLTHPFLHTIRTSRAAA